MSPILVVGFGLFATGFGVFFFALVSSGGAQKSMQFRVLAEILGGHHGRAVRFLLLGSLLLLMSGACLCFGAIASGDRARAERCDTRCIDEGFERGRIGPNAERTEDRQTWFVACICEDGGEPQQEYPAE